jgi:CRISPR system Cascade subunit CasD
MPEHLILRLEAPLMSFGGEAIDNFGVVRDFPAASMLTGLIANALGWRRGDTDKLDRLQDRLVFAVRIDRPGTRMRDFQTLKLEKSDRGWTTRHAPEGRKGGDATYDSPHLRFRDYDADALVCVALRLEPANEEPSLDAIAKALDEPARPLFLGRKPCLPAARIVAGAIEAVSVLQAMQAAPRLAADLPEQRQARVFWPRGDRSLEPARSRELAVTDRRNWRSGVHGGSRWIVEGECASPLAVQGDGR